MRIIFCGLLLALPVFLNAQYLIDFEDFGVPSGAYLNGSDGAGGFTSDAVFLPNDYNPDYQSWTGWALSAMTDTLSPGYTNLYSAIAGQGADASSTYALGYAFATNIMALQGGARQVTGISVTNTTYAYLSMRDGDAFAKKFGGLTGEDPDFFRLTIKGYNAGQLSADSIDFYLADFRFTDNSQDYIVKDWTNIDLSALGPVDSLVFYLTSSDVGLFGMNTPAFFCMDNVRLGEVVSVSNARVDDNTFRIFPNPASDYLQITGDFTGPVNCTILDVQGHPLRQQWVRHASDRIAVHDLPTGAYLLHLRGEAFQHTQVLIKK